MRNIEVGKTYKHFKGTVYKVLYIGYNSESVDSENPERLVIYKSSHDEKIWVRPYDNFISKVDKNKYPNATQEYRFEVVD